MAETQPFKNYYGVELAKTLAAQIQIAYPQFAGQAFIDQVARAVEPLELKDRVALIATALREWLPQDYEQSIDILLSILGPEIPAEAGMFNHGYQLMPVAYFVEVYGQDHFELSLKALYEITKRHTAEFALRPFLVRYPEETLRRLDQWTQDPNPHVRRLVSEGSRPRLPWASRLTAFIDDPSPVLALLARLRSDPSRYVQKSVANNLNDIAKDHPQLVLDTLRHWSDEADGATRWITRHALRSLVKQGHPEALDLLGFVEPQVKLSDLRLEPASLGLNDTLLLSFTLTSDSDEPQELMIDYIIHFVRPKGKYREKVFKLSQKTLPAGQSLQVQKRHPFRAVSVRRYYPGRHRVEIQVNGQILGKGYFELTVDPK
ncbi:MAG TPA: DNA alkylation repair protein [Anaerolineae bacterium]|nr:DNA alkylation repair protein [Anaerolineae bacterium]HMR66309.1 DNA alkylation repair protein [Anaerolineae bacterium]